MPVEITCDCGKRFAPRMNASRRGICPPCQHRLSCRPWAGEWRSRGGGRVGETPLPVQHRSISYASFRGTQCASTIASRMRRAVHYATPAAIQSTKASTTSPRPWVRKPHTVRTPPVWLIADAIAVGVGLPSASNPPSDPKSWSHRTGAKAHRFGDEAYSNSEPTIHNAANSRTAQPLRFAEG